MDMKEIMAAKARIAPYLPVTPLLYSNLLSSRLNLSVWLKLETQLPTGSFKPRPAFNSILTQLDEARKNGVIASSSGNFAQGVAFAANQLDIKAMIVMTEGTSPFKIKRTKELGAEVVICPNSHQERLETTLRLQKETGRVLLEPYNSYPTIAGDGTIGVELSDQFGDKLNSTTILVPVSGGGLLAGIALTLKSLYPQCKVLGIQSKANASMKKSLEVQQCVNVGKIKTIADALVASMPGEIPFKIIQQFVDDVILVEEDEIKSATTFLVDEHKLVVEPGGSLPIAALLTKKVTAAHCICIVSGGNIKLQMPF